MCKSDRVKYVTRGNRKLQHAFYLSLFYLSSIKFIWSASYEETAMLKDKVGSDKTSRTSCLLCHLQMIKFHLQTS